MDFENEFENQDFNLKEFGIDEKELEKLDNEFELEEIKEEKPAKKSSKKTDIEKLADYLEKIKKDEKGEELSDFIKTGFIDNGNTLAEKYDISLSSKNFCELFFGLFLILIVVDSGCLSYVNREVKCLLESFGITEDAKNEPKQSEE